MRNPSRFIVPLLGALLFALPVSTTVAAAPPPPAQPRPTDGTVDGPPDAERDAEARNHARRMIMARLERIRAEEASLEATLAAIEAGQPLHELRIPGRQDRGPEAGPDDERIRRDGDREREAPIREDFTDEQIEAFIAEVYPEWIAQIEKIRQHDPDALQKLLRDRRPRLVELMIERRDHPAVFEARQKFARSEMMIRRVAWSLARAENPEERQQAEAKLDTLIGEQFDLRIGVLEAELAEVETDAAKKRAEIAEARENRDTLIVERKADLIRAIRERRPGPRGDDSPGRGGRPGRPGPERPGGPQGSPRR
ncbi:MAG: hypothetical protein ACF8MJ_12890 [Phycisphaerales bacterium JB050]